MANYNVGATVSLKSGGPAMTVEAATGEDVVCIWFDGHQVRQTATFKRSTLKAHRPAPNGAAK